MDTRQILQILLGVIIISILGLGSFIVYTLTREADTQIKEIVIEEETEEVANPWSQKGDAAIELVRTRRVTVPEELARAVARGEAPADEEGAAAESEESEEVPRITAGELVAYEPFLRKNLPLLEGKKRAGWKAQWWGETEYGPSYYLVRYAFEDANLEIGPTWLVDLKEAKVVPKNILAEVIQNPEKAKESEYYDRARQVVQAITGHRFDSGVNLGGALLLYFEQRAETREDDSILGWTIDHDRGELFEAYFQWVEGNEATYAQFEFDYDRKALKAVNLQAANMMRIGEELQKQERVSIMPSMYDTSARNPRRRWVGPAKRLCRARPKRCKAMSSMFEQSELIESLEWLLSAQASTASDFEACQEKRNCRWKTQKKGEDNYRVLYIYNLERDEKFDRRSVDPAWVCPLDLDLEELRKKQREADKNPEMVASMGQCVGWDVDLSDEDDIDIEPLDRRARTAYRAVRPR